MCDVVMCCAECDCNGYDASCDDKSGECTCYDVGVVGPSCTACNSNGSYEGDADNICYCELTHDTQAQPDYYYTYTPSEEQCEQKSIIRSYIQVGAVFRILFKSGKI